MIDFESAPFTAFHRRVALSGAGGSFSDGYSLGIVGIALALAKGPLGLTAWQMGAVGAASLVGIFLGSLVAGSLSDRFGRRPVFVWGMLAFTVFAVLQYRSASMYELFFWRLLLGIAVGADYVSSEPMVAEYSPTARRGQLLSVLAIAWTAGYLSSFIVGYLIRGIGPDAWRIVLLTCAVPSLITFVLRFNTPESPAWLARQGRLNKAQDIISKHIGPGIALPIVSTSASIKPETLTSLFKPPLRRNLFVGCVFNTSQAIPWFALGTFLPIVLAKLNVGDGYTGALIYNVLLMLGGLIGMLVIDRIPRRTFLIQGFVVMAVFLAVLISWRTAPPLVTVPLFAAFAFVMSAAGILQIVYPPELFPTELRSRGIGVITACSRIGSASSTFLLPIVVQEYGVYVALSLCMAVCIVAALFCAAWAPETLLKRLM
jgi:MFS transporter, putative metabolite transport protein